jgi:copper homeostasis protein (lipoprotein)
MEKMKMPFLLAASIGLTLSLISCSTQSDISKDKTLPTGDNTMTSVDWDGMYFGVLPCADCEGIQTTIKLNIDLTYEIKTKYLGKDDKFFESKGHFSWNEEGNKITLTGTDVFPKNYFVGENMIKQLDMGGNQITGGMADKYVLRKALPEITNKYWKLVELIGKKVHHEEINKREPHMILRYDGNKVTGSGGCNTFNGTYELKESNRINFSKLATTLMACENMETEQEFFKVLEMADNYFLSADTLVLHKAKMAPLARFEAVYFK